MKERVATLLLIGLMACSVQDPTALINDSYTALGQGECRVALVGFEEALAVIDVNHPSYKRAKLGAIGAQVHIEPERAQADFLAFAAANKELVTEKDYRSVGANLVAVGEFLQAVLVLDAGILEFGRTDALLAAIEMLKQAAADAAGERLFQCY